MDNNQLYHWGVKGMKWGVRRKRQTTDSDDSRQAQQLRKKKMNEMSNKELRDLNTRLQLEQQYKNLTKRKNRGKQAVDAFVATATTIAAVTAAAATYKKLGNNVLDKIGDWVVKDIKF